MTNNSSRRVVDPASNRNISYIEAAISCFFWAFLCAMGILAARAEQWFMPLLGFLVVVFFINKLVVYARLRQFRGPRWTGFTDLPHSKALLQNCHEWYADISDKYGVLTSILYPLSQIPLNCIAAWYHTHTNTFSRTYCARRPQSSHHFFTYNLGSRQQQARIQTLRLVLSRLPRRISAGQCLHPDG